MPSLVRKWPCTQFSAVCTVDIWGPLSLHLSVDLRFDFAHYIFSNFPCTQDQWSGIKHAVIMKMLLTKLLPRWYRIIYTFNHFIYFLFFSGHCFSSVKEWWVLMRSTTDTVTQDQLKHGTSLIYSTCVDGLFSWLAASLMISTLMLHFYLVAAANGEEASGGASSAHSVWNDCGKLAGKPHPEGVSEGLLLGPSGHALPWCWTGRKIGLEVRDKGLFFFS